jgi:hypothetical protein
MEKRAPDLKKQGEKVGCGKSRGSQIFFFGKEPGETFGEGAEEGRVVFTFCFAFVSQFDFFYEVIPHFVEKGKEGEVAIEGEVLSREFSLTLALEDGFASLVG